MFEGDIVFCIVWWFDEVLMDVEVICFDLWVFCFVIFDLIG